ncbi:MAG TPA: cytochrome b N-terminal domain-containing protein [Vicinamibacterales bacterium]|nr:cytochrome b N-terminal domain-containing protein [Vicinamibacterales bacterium]
MTPAAPRPERLALRLLTVADTVANHLYSQRFNPLYQSGTIVVALYLVLMVTGLWLILFYRVGTPWESVAGIAASPWTGSWVRSLHRYASDVAVIATAVHAFRMFAQGRSRGARTMAWTTGWLLLLLIMICGWTGYVMVWDVFGQYLAQEGALILDALPVLSEPLSRAFTGEQPLPMAFFFLNLFAHIGVPLAMAAFFWLHVKRLARPRLLPPAPTMWVAIGALTVASLAWPVPMAPQANALMLPSEVPADVFFAFWIPLARSMGGRATALVAMATGIGLLVLPRIVARGCAAPSPSAVDEEICVGCNQCALDCPYSAITMVERDSRRSPVVARVDPALCVSCGICAGSCPPMGVGPPGRSGRDQLAGVRDFLGAPGQRLGEIVVVCCAHGAARFASDLRAAGGVPYSIDCAGNLHTSVIEHLLRGGVDGVLVLACPARDCRHREGAHWIVERVYHSREAELQERVNRARVRIANVNTGDRELSISLLRTFAADVKALDRPRVDDDVEPGTECAVAIAERVT